MLKIVQKKYLLVLKIASSALLALMLLFGSGGVNKVFAQSDMFIYPKKGQSPEQQRKDEYECYQWAKQNTGFDPMEAPKATSLPPAQEPPKGGVGRGALGGAALGAVIGGIADDDAGKGAAIGAVTGGLFGGMRRQKQKKQQEQAEQQWAQEQAGQYNQKRNSYNRAYTACLEARDYTVK